MQQVVLGKTGIEASMEAELQGARYFSKVIKKFKNSKKIRKLFNDILIRLCKIKEYKDIQVSIDLNPYNLN